MIINNELLDKIAAEAHASPRLRMNFNLHDNLHDNAQRLINVLLPCTIIPIHRHRHTAETYLLLRGRMFVVFYNEVGAQIERYLLDPTIGNYGVHIPKGQWHTVEVIEPSAILEVKDGPYTPLSPEDLMD